MNSLILAVALGVGQPGVKPIAMPGFRPFPQRQEMQLKERLESAREYRKLVAASRVLLEAIAPAWRLSIARLRGEEAGARWYISQIEDWYPEWWEEK